jgi:hypothetical protein
MGLRLDVREGGRVGVGRVESSGLWSTEAHRRTRLPFRHQGNGVFTCLARLFTLVPRLDIFIRHIVRLDIPPIPDEHTTTHTLRKSRRARPHRHILESTHLQHKIRAQHVARRRHVLGAPATRNTGPD